MLSFWCALLLISTVDSLLVVTPSGPIRGTVSKGSTSKEVDVFYGIPYAKPPTNNLRFAPPVEVKPWTKEFNASNSQSAPCYSDSNLLQTNELRSDDCLRIHIWVPKPTPKNVTVMVYIHGGGFVTGDPLELFTQGSTLAGEENVIVASMNYRLNTFGFLNFGRQDSPGNVGLVDQQLALKWIRKNIASFGGNPNDVTIFGMSAGGASVGFHLLAPSSRGLFQRAISMSGVPNAPWSFKHRGEVISNSKMLAKAVGCSNDDLDKTMLCLQNLHPKNIMVSPFSTSTENMAPIGPTVDGSFISDLPLNLLGNGSINDVDVMIGNTMNEGMLFAFIDNPTLWDYFPDVKINKDEFRALLNTTFRRHSPSFIRNLTTIFMKTEVEDPLVLRVLLDQIMSDFFFVCPSQLYADLFTAKTKKRVYRYVADHHFGQFSSVDLPEWMGTLHGIDTYLHLGLAAAGPPAFTEDEARLSKKVMKWWANFARTGNPNNGNDALQWPVSSKEKREFLRISTAPAIENNFRLETCSKLNALKGYLFK